MSGKPVAVDTEPILALDRNEYFFEHPLAIRQACEPAPDMLGRYARQSEQQAVSQAVASLAGVTTQEVLLGHGAEDLAIKLLTWFRRHTDVLVRLDFSWQVYSDFATHLDYTILNIPTPTTAENTYTTPVEHLDEMLTKLNCPAVVLLTSPNNPTGHATPAGSLAKLAARHQRHFFIVDCVYDNLASEHLPWVLSQPNAILLGSFSKFFGLPGIRLGFALGCKLPAAFHLPLGLQPWSLHAALAALQHTETYATNRRLMIDFAMQMAQRKPKNQSLTTFTSQTSFLLMRVNATPADTTRVHQALNACSETFRVRPKVFQHADQLFLRWGLGPTHINQRIELFVEKLAEELE